MNVTNWSQREPEPAVDLTAGWSATPGTVTDLIRLRSTLPALVGHRSRPAGGDGDLDALLLVFEELASNGLRHGRPPVRVVVAALRTGWLLDVSDAAAESPPVAADDQDPATGGLGLSLVAALSGAHGWTVDGDRKHIWARIDAGSSRAGRSPGRFPRHAARCDRRAPRGPAPFAPGAAGRATRSSVALLCTSAESGWSGRLQTTRAPKSTEEATMPDRAPGQGPPAALRPDGPLRRRPSDSVPVGRRLPRQRLLAALSRAVDRAPVTLVSGPAGSGKTVLAATWARRAAASTAVAWVRLGRDDIEVAEFWTAALSSLAGAGVPLPDVPRPVPGEPLPADFLDRLGGALAAAPTPVVLVLGDAGHLHGELVDGLHRLVAPAAARLRLVLTASADPLLLLGRYRAAGALAEIRGDQLAFRPPETRELMSRLGTPVSAGSAAELTAATDGSPTALVLAAAELGRGVPVQRLQADLAGTDTAPVHHLAAAVLAAQPPELRRFLLRASVTDHLWPELVQQLTGVPDPDRPLAALARAHAFVEPDAGAPGGYRIPGLLRTLLAAQLAHENPEFATILRRASAGWYAATGPLNDGVTPAVPAPPQCARVDTSRPGAPLRDRVAVLDLSPREREVLHQLAGGRSTTQMATGLAVSTNTVRGHVRTLQRKLAAPDRAGIVARARELDLL